MQEMSPPSHHWCSVCSRMTGVQSVVRIVLEALWAKFAGPVLLWPLLTQPKSLPSWAAAAKVKRSNSGTTPPQLNRAVSTGGTQLPSGKASTMVLCGDYTGHHTTVSPCALNWHPFVGVQLQCNFVAAESKLATSLQETRGW